MKNSLNITRLLIEIVLAIALAEMAVMFALPRIAPGIEGVLEATLDAILLSLIAGPIILLRTQAAVSRTQGHGILRASAGGWWTALVVTSVLLLGLGATGAASMGAAREVHGEAQAQFDRLNERLTDETQRRVNQIRYGLAGARGTYASIGELSRAEFSRYVESRDLNAEFPGAIGIGYIERVPRSDLDAFITKERNDGVPDFDIYALSTPDSIEHDDLYVIKHCFPRERNAKAWGLDIGSEQNRREAAERAVRTGEPAISGRIELVQDGRSRTAFLYFLPVFKNDILPATPRERFDALLGLVYSPIILDEALEGATSSVENQLDFEIYDGTMTSLDTLLYDRNAHAENRNSLLDSPGTDQPMFTARHVIHVGGREWTVITSTTPNFEARIDITTPTLIGIGGSILSMAIAGFTLSLITSRSRALSLAQEMTSDLSVAKAAAEEAMLETAAFRATLDQHSIITVADREGKIVDVNPQFCRVSGYTSEEITGKNHRILNSGFHPEEFWKDVWKKLDIGQAWHGEICNRAKNGTLYWVDSIIAPFTNINGEIEKYVSICSDITARKLGESEVLRISERLSLATQAGGVGIWEYDIVQNRLTWDEQMFRLYGVTPESFGGAYEAWKAGVHPDDHEESDNAIQAALRGEKDFDTEFRVIHPDGSIRHIQAIATVQRDEAGNPVRMVGTNWDVSEQRLAADELQAASAMLEEAQFVAKMGNWTFNLETGEVTWSKQLYSLFDRNEQDGPPDFEGVLSDYDEPSAQALREAVHKAAESGEPYSLVMRTSKQENGARYIRGEGRARFDEDGKVIGLFGTAMDVSAEIESAESLRQARIDAEAASRSKSAFLANMSHEIRTPLTAILGFAEMLREDSDSEINTQQRAQAVETIHNAGKHLLTVINDILDLSKIEAERMTVELIDTQIVSILHDIQSLMGPRASGKGITLNTVFSTPVHDRIMSDPTRIRQILMNLIGNAIKFTENGVVTVNVGAEVREGNERLVISVNDSGPGLSPEQIGNLFEAFGQANETVSRKYGGTGLGLTICRRLARLMGGTVKLVRTAPGEGACFEVDLPLKPAPNALMVSDLIAHDSKNAHTKQQRKAIRLNGRILLAEDGPDNQRLISFHLRKAGAMVEIAENGYIAIDMLQQAQDSGAPFDLLLTDMQMPEMDGYTLVESLRQSGNIMPIVALTAHAMEEDRIKCKSVGCDDFASKPIERNLLLNTCATWLQAAKESRVLRKSA